MTDNAAMAIQLLESDRQILMRVLTDCVVLDRLTEEERSRYMNIVYTIGLAAPPKPVAPEENIGSCEPSPLIRWDKTQQTWHTDVDKVGRYSIRRPAKRMPYQAYLNGKDLGLMPDSDPGVLKRSIERRIHEARRIATAVPDPDGFDGFHKTGTGNSFQVFGQGDQWFWWQREPEKDPKSRSDGPYFSAKEAYTVAMRNDD